MNQTSSPFEAGMKKHGLSILPRKPRPYSWTYAEPEDEYNARFVLAVKAHSLVMQYLEEHSVPFREEGFRYYDILKMACDEHGISYKGLFAKYEAILSAKD